MWLSTSLKNTNSLIPMTMVSGTVRCRSPFANIRRIYRQNYTSVYSFDYEFRVTAKHRFWLIRAASMPLLQIITYQNGQGCPWFHAVATFLHSKNSPSANVHGCTFADDVSTPSLCKSAGGACICVVAILTGCQWFHTVSSFSFMKNSKPRNVQEVHCKQIVFM